MPDLDLKPTEYRVKGVRRWLPHPLDGPQFTIWGVACAIWAGCVIGVCRYWIVGEPLWPVVFISMTPAAIWGVLLLLADKPPSKG